MVRTCTARCALLCAAIALGTGCAQDVGLIDRTQPGGMQKSVFDGEWYLQRTVVDTPFQVGWTFIGEAEETERIAWTITETHLIAYRAYDFIAGTDIAHRKRAKPGEDVKGQPVAVYPITAHFDVQREYSPTTGEQINVLSENTTDRPWYSRDWIRVNWAANEGINFMFPTDTVAMQAADQVITDPADPDALTMAFRDDAASNGTGWRDTRDPVAQRDAASADYIDFVTRVHATPQVIEEWDPWWGPASWPLCWFYLNEDCKAAEIKIRTSILKVDPSNDYQPLAYPDNYVLRDDNGKAVRVVEVTDATDLDNLKSAGLARVTPADADALKKAGKEIDDPTVVRVPMFDKFGYFRTERYGYDDKLGEVDAARPLFIARHDIWQRSTGPDGKPLPYNERKPKPIVYYLGQGFDPELMTAAKDVGNAWNDVFTEVVAARIGKPKAILPTMFEVRANTLAFDAAGHVTDRGQRVGDIRFSQFSLVNEPTRAGLLGYGPSSTDPTTGQIISGHAHSYAGPLKVYASTGRDILRLARGEIDPEDYGLGHVATEEVVKRLKRFAPSGASGGGKSKHADKVKDAQTFARRFANRKKVQSAGKLKSKLKLPAGWAHNRAQRVAGTPLEERLITADFALLMGNGKDKQAAMSAHQSQPLSLGKAAKARISPASFGSRAGRNLRRQRQRMLAERTIYHAAFAHDAVLGLAEQLKDVADPQEVWLHIYRDVFKSTALHEIGHTLGLRHNFEASSDALNYGPAYWKLRGKDGKALDLHDLPDEKLKAGLLDHRYNSIMEYASRFHHDTQGLAQYDTAAIAFGYGELVQVFGDSASKALEANKWFSITRNEIRYRLGLGSEDGSGKATLTTDPDASETRALLDFMFRGLLHYTQIPHVLGSVDNIQDRRWVPYKEVIAELSAAGSTGLLFPQQRKLHEVPFRFCSDEYESGTATCAVYDEGADPFEIVSGALDKWRDYYFVRSFRRDRTNFYAWDYEGHVYGVNFLPVLNQYQHWVNQLWDDSVLSASSMWDWLAEYRGPDLGIVEDPGSFTGYIEWSSEPIAGLAGSAGVRTGLNTLASVISTPEPGAYCYNPESARYEWLNADTRLPKCKKVETCFDNGTGSQETGCADLIIPLGQGRYEVTEYDTDSGYYYFERLKHIGAFYDKWTALNVLTTPDTMFIGVDASQALNNYVISTMLYFRPEMMRFFGALIAGREDQFGWKVDGDRNVLPTDLFLNDTQRATREALPPIAVPGLYNMRPSAMWMGMAFFNYDWDQSFNHSAKVWIEGGVDAITPPAAATVASFDNPLDNRTYKAVKMGDPSLYSIGYEMVMICKRFVDRIDAAKQVIADPTATPAQKEDAEYTAAAVPYDLEWAVQYLELLRGYQDLYGLLVW